MQTLAALVSNNLTILMLWLYYFNAAQVPKGWIDDSQASPEQQPWLCCDCIVGIADPLRPDVVNAVQTAKQAGA
jgi:magnesium-transporting ATPase (P-type)